MSSNITSQLAKKRLRNLIAPEPFEFRIGIHVSPNSFQAVL
ncbi:hypothetical protein SAMN05661012_02904 [Chitinophaga sancti]|uniref:Uncharacterized protein n=1 Tax=Chitinophaga sancti TaxID=1004 RepID=A0A1K1QLT8_9BACT|nr:hypothetical protein SAMN05661012_02904 [Chitinophaga sancti]